MIIFFIEWFLYHPALRYGGYHLIYLIIFIPFSIYISNFDISYKIFRKKAVILILITVIIFTFRNFNRLNLEYEKYNYNPILSLNYKFIGGDKKFHYRYNSHIKDRLSNYNSFQFLGKKFVYLSRENFNENILLVTMFE